LQLRFSKSRIFKLFAGLVNQFFTQLASEKCRFFSRQGQQKKYCFQIERTLMGTNPTGTITGTLTLIIIPSSLIIHDAIASWRHTPQSLRDSSPNLGEQFVYLRI